jgi:hypothetical protein
MSRPRSSCLGCASHGACAGDALETGFGLRAVSGVCEIGGADASATPAAQEDSDPAAGAPAGSGGLAAAPSATWSRAVDRPLLAEELRCTAVAAALRISASQDSLAFPGRGRLHHPKLGGRHTLFFLLLACPRGWPAVLVQGVWGRALSVSAQVAGLPCVGVMRDVLARCGRGLAITMDDFRAAVAKVQPSVRREGFSTKPDVSWEDVGSLADIREELSFTITQPIAHPERFEAMGIAAATGVLLYGPPGVHFAPFFWGGGGRYIFKQERL